LMIFVSEHLLVLMVTGMILN